VLKIIGDIGFLVAGVGSAIFTILFLGTVKWWTDVLGRVLACVVGSIGIIMALSMVRLFGLPLPGLFWWRAIMFNALALAIWSGVIAFSWSQFFAPRRRARRARSDKWKAL